MLEISGFRQFWKISLYVDNLLRFQKSLTFLRLSVKFKGKTSTNIISLSFIFSILDNGLLYEVVNHNYL